MRKDLLCVVLGSITRLALVLLGTIADVVGLLLRKADDLLLTGNGEGLLLSVGDDGIGLGGGGSHKLLALLKDTAGLLPLLGIAHADLVEDVEEHVGVDDLELSVLAERRLGFLDQPFELIDQADDPIARKILARHPVSFHR